MQKAEARWKVMALSEKYGLRGDPDALISDISVGMQLRVEILKMLYRDNEILIFDEPTAVLTPQEIDELMEIMRGFKKEGKSILFITHKLNEIMAVAARCSVLRKGKYMGTVDIKDTTKEELSRMMVGRDVQLQGEKKPAAPGKVVLDAENVTMHNAQHKKDSVKNVSFQVHAGEIVCLAGIEGNGQTEFVYGLTGLEKLPRVKRLSGIGLMVGIEFLEGIKAADVLAACREKGLLVLTAKTRLRLLPPLTLTAHDVEKALAILNEVLSEMAQKSPEEQA